MLCLVGLIAVGCGGESTVESSIEVTATTEIPATTEVVTATNEAVTTTSAVVTTTTETLSLQIARDSMEVWNTGDIDAYLGFYADDGVIVNWPAHSDQVREGIEYYVALGNQVTIDDCEEWEDGTVHCLGTETDDLSGLAGATVEAEYRFWITDGKITRYSAALHGESALYFVVEMIWWLESAHPDVWESAFALEERCSMDDVYNCRDTWYANPETAAALLEYAPEFIAQSDKYPLEE
jgi:hypothetical protein